MDLGTDGMQPHAQGSATPAGLFERTTAGPLRKWSDKLTMKIKPERGCEMECKCCKSACDAASQLQAASTGSSRIWHNPQGSRKEENEVEEVDS